MAFIGKPIRMAGAAILAVGVLTGTARSACEPAPEPVLSLTFDSRYEEDSETRSDIDPATAAAADDALRQVESFLRELADSANDAMRQQDTDIATCVLGRMAVWAEADALNDLGSKTAAMTVGSRLAGFGMILWQMAALTGPSDEADVVAFWLDRRIAEQITFWEAEAPQGAAQGNLRAWAALAAAARAAGPDAGNRNRFAYWSAASASYVLCSAAEDGSLPQEMRRGPRAMQYQIHSVTALVVTAALLEDIGLQIENICDHALNRTVGFVLADLEDGAGSAAHTEVTQSFFNGSDEIEAFHLAWIMAYQHLPNATYAELARVKIAGLKVLNYSKLGGDQFLIWK